MENIIDGYNIDKNQSGLVQLSNEDLHAQLLIWMDDPEQSPQCIYVKYVSVFSRTYIYLCIENRGLSKFIYAYI